MDHVQGFLSSAAEGVSTIVKGIPNPFSSTEESPPTHHCDITSSVGVRRRSGSLRKNDVEQPVTTSSERNRRRESLLRRHEHYLLSTRRSLSGSNFQIPSRRLSQPSYRRLDEQRNQSERSQKQESEKDDDLENEGTPLMGRPPLPSPRKDSAQRGTSSDSSDDSETSLPFLPGRKRQPPALQNAHWANIKKEIDQGTFSVTQMLSKDNELLDMEDEQEANENTYTNTAKTVEELRRQAIENFQKGSTFSPQLCLLAILVYMIIAVFMFCLFLEPQWTVIDSCYFAVSTFTTLGYGDLAPTSTMSVIFTTVYALAGVACLGLALGILGSKLLETKEDRRWYENYTTEYAALTMFDHEDSSDLQYDSDDDCGYFEPVSEDNDVEEERKEETEGRMLQEASAIMSSENGTKARQPKEVDKNVKFSSSVETGSAISEKRGQDDGKNTGLQPPSEGNSSTTCSKDNRQSAKLIDSRTTYGVGLARFVVLLTIAMFFAFLIGYQSGWGFWSTFYYSVTTAATIGYGDLTPHTQETRFLAIIFIPFACAVTGQCLAWFAKWIIEKQGAKYRKSTFESHNELTPEDLRVMDITGDGKVAWFEFLEFMLVAMKKVDPELLDELRDYFDRLDVSNTGELSKDTLIEMARRKMKSPRRKLELYEYKQHLLRVGLRATHEEEKPRTLGKWFQKGLGFLGIPTQHYSKPPNTLQGLPKRGTPS